MAGDWMKVEHATPEKPEVFAMAAMLDRTPDEVFGICFRMWRWFDQHTETGNAASVTPALLERYLGVTGFAHAALTVGWLEAVDGPKPGIRVPNFDRHNGVTARRRALTVQRVSRHKAKKRGGNAQGNGASVNLSSLYSFLFIKENQWVEESLDNPDFAQAWDTWIEHRAGIKKPMKEPNCKMLLKKFARWGPERSVAAIEHTVANGWQGIREPEGADKPAHDRVATAEDAIGWTP